MAWCHAVALLAVAAVASCGELLPMTLQQKQQLLDAHNLWRARTARGETPGQPAASDMLLMEWDDRLASTAATWVAKCVAGHDSNDDRLIPGYSAVGQNWAGSYNQNFSTRVNAWSNEFPFYTYGSGGSCKPGEMCGHYTQVVWAKSKLVGCAAAKCSNYPVCLVCNYAPAGNYRGQAPYTQRSAAAAAASSCPGDYSHNMGGLCASRSQCQGQQCSCAIPADGCQNGEFDASACRCSCRDGFYGQRCQKECKDEAGWEYTCSTVGKNDCARYGHKCPKSCNRCVNEKPDAAAQNSAGAKARVLGLGAPSTTPSTTASTTVETEPPTSSATVTVSTPTTRDSTEEPPATTEEPPATTEEPPTTTSSPAPNCNDVYGSSRCAAYRGYCDRSLVRVLCPRTCGSCEDASQCRDWHSACASRSCRCPVWRAICRRKCSDCAAAGGGGGGGSGGVLPGISDCSDASASYCGRIASEQPEKCRRRSVKLYCPSTCGGNGCALRRRCKDYWSFCRHNTQHCSGSWKQFKIMCKKSCGFCS